MLGFQGGIKIYNDYDVFIQGSLSSNYTDWQITLDGEFLSNIESFHASIISFLTQHLHTELRDVFKKLNRSIQAIAVSESWQNKLYEELNQKQ